MKKTVAVATSAAVLILLSGTLFAGEKAPQKMVDLANTTPVKLGSDPLLVRAVKAENAKGKTMAQIKTMDKERTATPG